MEDELRDWFVGVDWGAQTHHVFVIDAEGCKLGERGFAHGGEGLADMAPWVSQHTGAAPDAVSVAIEVPHGPVVESLMERGFRVHAINPKQLDRFRDRFSPAGAKDDSRDAHVLADALRTDPRCLCRLDPRGPGHRRVLMHRRARPCLGHALRPLPAEHPNLAPAEPSSMVHSGSLRLFRIRDLIERTYRYAAARRMRLSVVEQPSDLSEADRSRKCPTNAVD